ARSDEAVISPTRQSSNARMSNSSKRRFDPPLWRLLDTGQFLQWQTSISFKKQGRPEAAF
ncbi:MAG TPA: hypothetical protein VGD75_20635, partial [Bradyrhizobium sp.]